MTPKLVMALVVMLLMLLVMILMLVMLLVMLLVVLLVAKMRRVVLMDSGPCIYCEPPSDMNKVCPPMV